MCHLEWRPGSIYLTRDALSWLRQSPCQIWWRRITSGIFISTGGNSSSGFFVARFLKCVRGCTHSVVLRPPQWLPSPGQFLPSLLPPVSRLGMLVRRSAGKRKDAGSSPRFGSPFSSKVVIYGHCLVTLPCTINHILKWLTSLPILTRKSFWWWQCSG